MITLHHLNNSRSQRVLWLLEEIGTPYEIRHYQRNPKTLLAPPELRAVHPLGKSPVITEDRLVVAESGAILEYLVERHGGGRFVPKAGTPEALRYRYWMHYAEGSAMPPMLMKLVFDQVAKRAPAVIRPVARLIAGGAKKGFIFPQIKQHLDFMEAELAQRDWFACDEFTAADIQLSFPLESAVAHGVLDSSRPRLMDFLARIHARPAYQRALEKGGPYSMVR